MSGGPLPLHPVARAIGAAAPRAASVGVGFVPPPLPRRGERHDGLTAAQRHAMVGAILAAHVAGAWGLLQIREVREAVAEAAPMFVSLVAPRAAEAGAAAPASAAAVPQPVLKQPPPIVIAAAPAPTPAPAPFVVPPPPEVVPPPAAAGGRGRAGPARAAGAAARAEDHSRLGGAVPRRTAGARVPAPVDPRRRDRPR